MLDALAAGPQPVAAVMARFRARAPTVEAKTALKAMLLRVAKLVEWPVGSGRKAHLAKRDWQPPAAA